MIKFKLRLGIVKTKVLNLIDLYRYRKDFIWGKGYYASIEDNRVVSSILYSKYLEAKKALELHEFDTNHEELLKDFISHFSLKEDIHYFISKLAENDQVNEITFLQAQGFRRLTREYLFEYREFKTTSLDTVNILCETATHKDIKNMIQICKYAQPIEFRDYLFHYPDFFKGRLNDTYIFYPAKSPENILGYACKIDPEKNIFEFIVPPTQALSFISFLVTFVDKYIHFEKNENFSFIVNENIKDSLDEIQEKFKLKQVKQVLIQEAKNRDKVKLLKQWGNKIQIPVPNGQVSNKSKIIDSTKTFK